jgi:hypothetical protein
MRIPEFHMNHLSCLIWAEGLPMPLLRARPAVARVVQSAASVRQQPAVNASREVRQAVNAMQEAWQQAANVIREVRLLVNAKQVAPRARKIPLFMHA